MRVIGVGVVVVLVLGLEAGDVLVGLVAHEGQPVADLEDLAGAVLAERRRRAGDGRVVGVELAVVAAFDGRLHEQREVRAPVAGDDRVGARRLDLGDVGREIAHLRDRVQVLADDLDVRALPLQVFLRELGDLHAVRIVLAEDVDLVDVLLVLHEGGDRLHLHRRVGVEAEVPEAALAVSQVGVDRGLVQKDDFLAGVASLYLLIASMSGTATDEPLPWIT